MFVTNIDVSKITIEKIFLSDNNYVKVESVYGDEILFNNDSVEKTLADREYFKKEFERFEVNYFLDDTYHKELYIKGERVKNEKKKRDLTLLINDFENVYAIFYDDEIHKIFTHLNDVYYFLKNVIKVDYKPIHIYSYINNYYEEKFIVVRGGKIIKKLNTSRQAIQHSVMKSEFSIESPIVELTSEHEGMGFIKEIDDIYFNF